MPKILCTLFLMAAVATASAADVSIGPFCMSGVSAKTDASDTSFSDGVQWIRVQHTYRAPSAGSRASLVVFSKPVPHDPGAPPDCAQLRARAAAAGIGIILDGLIDSLNMKSRLGIGSPGNRLWIDSDGLLLLTMKKVNSGLQRVGGGRLQLKGSHLWMRNVGTFLSTPERISGVLEIEAYDRTIFDAKFTFPGGTVASTTLKQREPDKENVFLRVNMATGNAQVWRGDMVATKVNITGPNFILPKMKLAGLTIRAETLALKAVDGVLKGTLSKVKGTASNLATDEDRITFNADAVYIPKGDINGNVTQNDSKFNWQDLKVNSFEATSQVVTMSADKKMLVKGPATAIFAKIAGSELSGTIRWDKPAVANLPLTIPEGKTKDLEVSLSGNTNGMKISGNLNVGAFGFSGMQITRDLALAFTTSTSDSNVVLPIDINAPGFGGEILFSDYDQKALLRAELADFRLKAGIFLDFSDLENSRIEVPPNGLSAGLSGTASLVPWLAGTKPGFGKVGVRIANSELIVIRRTKPFGNVDFETDVLLIAEPVMRIGDGAEQRRASLKIDAVGGANFSYGVDERTLVLQKAKFEANDLDFRMLDGGGSMDIGGTLVYEPHVTMKRLFIDLDRKKNIHIMEAENLLLQGTKFSRGRTEKSETAFNGTQKSPFSINKIAGEPEFNSTSITVRAITAEKLSFAIKDATMTLGESLVMRNATISVDADRIRSVDEIQKKEDGSEEKDEEGETVWKRREYFTNFRVAADGKLKESEFADSMQLDVPPTVSNLVLQATGRSDLLDGSGGLEISPFSGLVKSTVEFQFACKGGTHPIAPTETRFSTGGSVDRLGVQINKGKFAVEGILAGLNLAYKGDTQVECDSDSQSHVLSPQQEWWTWGICPTWTEPTKKCRWSTVVPEVSFSYHLRFGFYHLAGLATVGAPLLSIKGGETKFCFLPPVIFNPLAVAMGISPQVEFSGNRPGDVEKILNGIIHTALVPLESGLATFVGNTAALGVGSVFTDPTGAILACALLRKDISL